MKLRFPFASPATPWTLMKLRNCSIASRQTVTEKATFCRTGATAESLKLEFEAYVGKKLAGSVSKNRSFNNSVACQTTLKSGKSSRANIILICFVGYIWGTGIEE